MYGKLCKADVDFRRFEAEAKNCVEIFCDGSSLVLDDASLSESGMSCGASIDAQFPVTCHIS